MATPNWSDAVLDASLNKIATATRVDACATEPTTFTEATSTNTIGNYTLTGGDWTVANGDVSGRKVTLGVQVGNNATGTGNANFLAFTDGVDLLGVADGDGDPLVSGSPWTVAELIVAEIRDPTI